MEKGVYCIIVTYNAMKWVDRCLTSLRESTVMVHPVVIDNCSKDATVEYIRNHYPEAHLIINEQNRGFGQANNQGIEWAYKQGASHFFLLNQDAWVHPNTIERLIKVQDNNRIAIASPVHLNGPGDRMDYGFFNYSILQDNNIRWVSDMLLDSQSDFYRVEFVNAAAWMLSKKTIEEIGGFDPLFFHYGEDRNYSHRIEYHKKEICIVPNAYIHHDRELKGNVAMFNRRKYISALLQDYTNVNGKGVHFKKSRVISAYNLLHNLITFRWKEFYFEASAYFFILFNYSRIRRSRKINQTLGHNWLDL